MEIMIALVILCYSASTAVYIAYLFVQKNYLHNTGCYLMMAGFVCHSISVGYSFVQTGRMPVQNLHETLQVAAWALVGVFIVFRYKFNVKILGIYTAPLAALIMIIAFQMPREPAYVKEIMKSFWLIGHVLTIFIGEASFALACGVGLLYLLQEHAIKKKRHGFFFKRLPSLELLDSTGYACIVVGFTMLTIGLITGIVYAGAVWGKFWSWDPKEVWSAITWLLYAALLHERLTVGWRGRRSAIMAVVGFAFVVFTFFGVNFFLKGHHWEFTRW